MSRICSVGGCENKARRSKAGLCERHYIRLYRTGSILRAPTVVTPSVDSGGYVRVGSERMHRIAWRYHYGTAPCYCWGCRKLLVWGPEFHIDHIDKDKTNNAISNLRPSCRDCNVGREPVGCSRMLSSKGRTLNIAQWAREPDVNVTAATIRRRLKAGDSPTAAIFGAKRTHNRDEKGIV